MKDIFVPLEIAKKLKEIGFDEPCIGAYDIYCMLHIINSNDKFSLERDEIMYYAPTYEQTFKWFRERGYESYIKIEYPNVLNYKIYITDFNTSEDTVATGFTTYEEAREEAILKLIELYAT